ncbi:MAG TPA: hypothetical protein VF950_11865 [Planctomycetota bacterium]
MSADADTASPFRRRRVLLVLGPLAGTLGAFVGVAAGLDGLSSLGQLSSEGLCATGAAFSFLATFATLAVIEIGWLRGRPCHALKACGALAFMHFFPGMLMGKVIAGMGC